MKMRGLFLKMVHDFNHMAERLESLVGAQRLLLRDVSHELRSPLSRLSVAVELAREDADPALEPHLAQNGISTPLVGLDLVFPSTATGRHFHAAPAQQDYIRPAGCCLMACPKCGAGVGVWCLQDAKTPNGKRLPLHDERWDAAGKYGSVGWHTFRHTYRSWLDSTSAPIGVQQKLMRHAQVSTTMNVYGNA